MSRSVLVLAGGCIVLGLVWSTGLLSFAAVPSTGEAPGRAEGASRAARESVDDVLRRARQAPEVGAWDAAREEFNSGKTRWEDTLTFEQSADGVSVLDVLTPHGNVEIVGDDGDSVRVSARRVVRSTDKSKGAEYRDGFRPIARRDAATLVVDVLRPERRPDGKNERRPKHVKEASVDFTITVPRRLAPSTDGGRGPALHVQSGHGDVAVRSAHPDAISLRTGHGDVALSDVTGDVDLHSGHGDLAVEDSRLTALDARTGHGDVVGSDVRGSAAIHTGHGDVRMERVEGGVDIRTGHGDINLEDCGGSATLNTGHGNLAVLRGSLDNLDAQTGHGDVRAEFDEATGSIDLRTGNGDVALRAVDALAVSARSGRGGIEVHITGEVSEALDLHTGHGDISVKAGNLRTLEARSGLGSVRAVDVSGLLNVKTGAGDVGVIAEAVGEVVAHSGTGRVEAVVGAIDGRAELTSSNGDVSLAVSDDQPFSLDAVTSNGRAECRLDLANAERSKDGRSVRGGRLGGGPDVRLRSGSGDVVVLGAR